MTIQIRGSATTSGTGASPRTATKPTGVTTGDLIVLHVGLADDIAPTVLPSGFTLISGAEITGTNNIRLYAKVAGGSEPADYTVEFASGNGGIGLLAIYSDTGKVLTVDDVKPRTNSSSTNRTWDGVMSLSPSTWMVMFGTFSGTSATTPPGSATERYDVGASAPRIYLMTEAIADFGDTGTRNGTGTGMAQKLVSLAIAEPTDGAAIRGITTALQSSTDSRSVDMPPRTVEDDLILIATMSNDASAPTMPGGFTLVNGINIANGIRIYKKRAGVGEAGPYTVDFPAGATNNNVAAISLFSHEGHLVDVDQSSVETTASSTNVGWAQITPTVEPGLLLAFASRPIGNGVVPDASMDEIWDQGANLHNFLMVSTYTGLSATGTRTATSAGAAVGYAVLLNVAEIAATLPTAPSNLVATAASQTQIDLTWDDNSSDETGFEVERSLDGSTGWALIHTTAANVESYSDTSLSAGQQRYYRVRAVNLAGGSAYTNVDDATTTPDVPADPSSLSATGFSTTQINLDWTDNSSNETGFKIERSPNGTTGWVEIATTAAGDSDYEDTGLTPGTEYFYRVRAYNAGGNSGYTTVESAETHPAFAAPTNLVATALTARIIRLTWDDNTEYEIGYQIERSSDGTTGWTVIATVIANIEMYDDEGLQPETQYYYRVRGYQEP